MKMDLLALWNSGKRLDFRMVILSMFVNLQCTFNLFSVDILLGKDGPQSLLNVMCHLGVKERP